MNETNLPRPKRGSSRRKGDKYQDLTALRLGLELYISKVNFKLFMEYDNKGNLDDVVIFINDSIITYQIKYSVNPFASYSIEDFIDKSDPNKKRVFIKKFADGWKEFKKSHPNKNIKIILLSNHSIDVSINELINDQGYFLEDVINNKKYKEPRKNRNELLEKSQLNDEEFKLFLKNFQFRVKEKDLDSLKAYIKNELLNAKLGIDDNSIYYKLRNKFEEYAIYSQKPIDFAFFNQVFERNIKNFLLPQIFGIKEKFFIERNEFHEKFKEKIQNLNNGYLIITGLPGSGKSTTLTNILEDLRDSDDYEVLKYYCFVDINDNHQNLRIEAQSLRVNLLHQIQESFFGILDRRYDYSENNFYKVLKKIGGFFFEKNKKLLILLDGLDHAERMISKIQNSLFDALPKELPKGIIFIVGTQELHKWPLFFKIIKDNPDNRIELPLFNFTQTEEYLVKKLGKTVINSEEIEEIFKISEGLPIYLNYISELILSSESVEKVLNNLTPLETGEIKNYYNYLWDEFEKIASGNIRYLCCILACLRFPVKKEELIKYQQNLDLPSFQESFEMIKHLIRINEDFISFFHNSFREFVLSQFDDQYLKTINSHIFDYLSTLEQTDSWYGFVFEYAYTIGNYDYILEIINLDFVDNALANFRSIEEIKKAIFYSIKSAKKKESLVSLSRLSILKNITEQRIEYHMNWALLSRVLLNLGDVGKVVRYSYSINQNRWLVNKSLALYIINKLAKRNFLKNSRKLFEIFKKTISSTLFENKEELISFCKCLGIHSVSINAEMEFITNYRIQPGGYETNHIEDIDKYLPHLEAYISSLIIYHNKEYWIQLKEIDNDFLKERISYYIIQNLAKNEEYDLLSEEIKEYLSYYNENLDLDLIYYMTLIKYPKEIITEKVGDLNNINIEMPEYLKYDDDIFESYRKKFWILGYLNNESVINNLKTKMKSNKSWWNDYLLYLLITGEICGHSLSDQSESEDLIKLFQESLNLLLNIKIAKNERLWDLLRNCQHELKTSLFHVMKCLISKYPTKVSDLLHLIRSLQTSQIWTKRVNIGESADSYLFELNIYKKFSQIKQIRPNIMMLLDICEKKILNSTMIKGGSRVNHFFLLSLISSRCGFIDKSKEWLMEGIKSTLIYGYRKDMTLYVLIQILDKIRNYNKNYTLLKCANILELIDWMPHLTDGRETNHFPRYIFEQVLKINEKIALKILILYAKTKKRWQMQNCLEDFIKHIEGEDQEYLWALTSIFTNEYSEDERFSNQVFDSKQKIVDITEELGEESFLDFKDRLHNYVKTWINPKNYSKLNAKYENYETPKVFQQKKFTEEKEDSFNKKNNYKYKDDEINRIEIIEKLKVSFKNFKDTISILKDANENFYIDSEFSSVLVEHVINTKDLSNLYKIREFIEKEKNLQYSNIEAQLGEKFYLLGDIETTLICYENMIMEYFELFNWKKIVKYLNIIKSYDKGRAKSIIINKVYKSIKKYSGFGIPSLISTVLETFGEKEKLFLIFEDFFEYSKCLFRHLPKKEDYRWIKDYTGENETFEQLTIQLLINELDTPEIDLGNRLVDSIAFLCIKRTEALHFLMNNFSKTTFSVRNRIVHILYKLSLKIPDEILQVIEKTIIKENLDSFILKMMIKKIFTNIKSIVEIKKGISEKINSISYNLSEDKNRITIKIPKIKPSNDFINFSKNNLSLWMKNRILGCCEILEIDYEDFIGIIEQSYKKNNITIEEERERLKDDWYGYVHPQGHPYVNIMTRFENTIVNIVDLILNELLNEYNISKNQIESLWRLFQPIDPDYELSNLSPRPKDIELPLIHDKESWFDELNSLSGKTRISTKLEEWTPLFDIINFDFQDIMYNRYVRRLIQTSSLIKSNQFYYSEKNLIDLESLSLSENFTLQQAIQCVSTRDIDLNFDNVDLLPVLEKKNNYFPFLGYKYIIFFPREIIERYNLDLQKNQILYKKDIIAKFIEWQEGYVTESYSRNLQAFGTRFLIKSSFLEVLFQDFEADLCQRYFEERLFYKDIFKRKETDKKIGMYFKIIK